MLVLGSTSWPSSMNGARENSDDLARHDCGTFLVRHLRQQHGELIPAQTRHGIGLAHAGRESLRHPLQQQVANMVAQGIVHRP